jgi:hypothetical protein
MVKHGDQVMWWWSAYHDVELEQGATSDAHGKGIMLGFLFCIQDTIEGVDGIGSIDVL